MKPGIYTVEDIMSALGFSMEGITDYRRVKVGGLGFDYLDQKIRIPETAGVIEISLDGKVAVSKKVK